MKILQVNDYGYQAGGAENYFFSLSKGLRDSGQEVLTLTSNHRHPDQPILSDQQISECGHCFNMDSFFNPRNYFEFKKVLRQFKPEVIHFHNVFYALSPSVIYAAKNFKTVLTLHDYAGICFGDKRLKDGSICNQALSHCRNCSRQTSMGEVLRKKIAFNSLKRINKLIAPSNYLKGQFEINGFNNLTLLRHPFSYEKLPTLPLVVNKDRKYFLYLGRLAEQKGLILLLDAISELGAEVLLHIAGSGPEEAKLKNYCHTLGIAERVVFHGWVDEVKRRELFSEAIALVIPSLWPENSPLVLGEAAANSVPVIAAMVGGLGEFIINHENGLLFKAGELDDLKRTMQSALSNKEVLPKLAETARAAVIIQTLSKHIESLRQLYRQ